MNLSQLFKQNQIKFGTSGIRANNSALSDQICYAATLAFLNFLQEKGLLAAQSKFALAGDLRQNTDKISRCILQALADKQLSAVYLGKIPTPALGYYCEQEQCPGMMVTGSHIEASMNGIKFYLASGEILKEDEQIILDQTLNLPVELFSNNGSFKNEAAPLPIINPAGQELFLKRYLNFFPADALQGLRLGVYQHSTVAAPLLMQMLEALGATLLPFGQAQDFQSIDTEALSPSVIQLAPEKTAALKLDAIVSTDGDGDRPLIADEKGNWLRGDLIGMLSALVLKAEYVVLPITCNSSVDQLSQIKQVIRTRVGSPYVVEGMNKLLKQGKDKILGYEANGGVLLGTSFTQDQRCLSALPTRDGILPSLCLLSHINQAKISLSTFADQYQTAFTASSSLKDFSTEKFGWFQQCSEEQSSLLQKLQTLFNPKSPICHISHTDGLRVTFENGAIIHLRCSGNSPELRCYTETNTEQKALKLNTDCSKLLSTLREKQDVQTS